MKQYFPIVLFTSLFAVPARLSAQCVCPPCPLVDITLVDDGSGALEVRLRPDGFFDQLVSQLQFTIRWETASGASLGAISQTSPAIDYMALDKWGTEVDTNGYRYQVFGGLGWVTMAGEGTSWSGGVEYTMMTVPVTGGSSTFEIAADPWTVANNADYYISLCGTGQTGVIYLTPTGIGDPAGPQALLEPNPTTGMSWLDLNTVEGSAVRMEVINATGQVVIARDLGVVTGARREPIDLSGEGAGVYLLKVVVGDRPFTHRLVVK